MHSTEMKELARRMYIHDGLSVEEIASKVRASKSTVDRWRTLGGWHEKRAEYIETETSFAVSTMKFAKRIMLSLEDQYDAHTKIDKGELDLLKEILGRIAVIQKVEDHQRAQAPQDDMAGQIPPEVMADPEVQKALELISRKIDKFEALCRG